MTRNIYLADNALKHFRGGWEWAERQPASNGGPRRLRILLSYWYWHEQTIAEDFPRVFGPDPQRWPDVFIDSGAYSAWSQGGSVDIHAYADWLQRPGNAAHISVYANLDVKGDVAATARNQQTLEAKGLRPLPVFHGGEPWSVLRDYIADYPYIALGGIAGGSVQGNYQVAMRWLLQAFRLAAEGPRTSVYHGFGLTSWRVLKNLPFYSVDSTSWLQGIRFGTANVFDPRRASFHKLALGDRQAWYKERALIRRYGFDPAPFATRVGYHHLDLAALCAASYLEAEAWLCRRWPRLMVADRGRRPHLLLRDEPAQTATPTSDNS